MKNTEDVFIGLAVAIVAVSVGTYFITKSNEAAKPAPTTVEVQVLPYDNARNFPVIAKTVSGESNQYLLIVGSTRRIVRCDYSFKNLDEQGRPNSFSLLCTGSFDSK